MGSYVYLDSPGEILLYSREGEVFYRREKGYNRVVDSLLMSRFTLLPGGKWEGVRSLLSTLRIIVEESFLVRHVGKIEGTDDTHLVLLGRPPAAVSPIPSAERPDIHSPEIRSPRSEPDDSERKGRTGDATAVRCILSGRRPLPEEITLLDGQGNPLSKIAFSTTEKGALTGITVTGAPGEPALRCSLKCIEDSEGMVCGLEGEISPSTGLSLMLHADIEWDDGFRYYNSHYRVPAGTRQLNALQLSSYLSRKLESFGF